VDIVYSAIASADKTGFGAQLRVSLAIVMLRCAECCCADRHGESL